MHFCVHNIPAEQVGQLKSSSRARVHPPHSRRTTSFTALWRWCGNWTACSVSRPLLFILCSTSLLYRPAINWFLVCLLDKEATSQPHRLNDRPTDTSVVFCPSSQVKLDWMDGWMMGPPRFIFRSLQWRFLRKRASFGANVTDSSVAFRSQAEPFPLSRSVHELIIHATCLFIIKSCR